MKQKGIKTNPNNNSNKIVILLVGILIGVGGLLLIQNLTAYPKSNKLIIMDHNGNMLSVNKPKIKKPQNTQDLYTGSQGKIVTDNSEFNFFTRGGTELHYSLCDKIDSPDNGDDKMGGETNCLIEDHTFGKNVASVVYKTEKDTIKYVAIIIKMNKLSDNIEVEKTNNQTNNPDFFTQQEIQTWLEAIEKW